MCAEALFVYFQVACGDDDGEMISASATTNTASVATVVSSHSQQQLHMKQHQQQSAQFQQQSAQLQQQSAQHQQQSAQHQLKAAPHIHISMAGPPAVTYDSSVTEVMQYPKQPELHLPGTNPEFLELLTTDLGHGVAGPPSGSRLHLLDTSYDLDLDSIGDLSESQPSQSESSQLGLIPGTGALV